MESGKIILVLKRVLLITLIFVSQTVFADKMRIMGVSPNLTLAFILVVAFKNYPSYGLYASLTLGFLTDAVSGRIFGGYTFLFVLIEELIKNYYTKLFTESFLFEFFGGLAFNFLFSLLYGLGEWFFYSSFAHIFLKIALIECLYNQVVFTFFLFVSKKIKKKRRSIFRI